MGKVINGKYFRSRGIEKKKVNILKLFYFLFVFCRLTISLIYDACGVTGCELPSCPDPGTNLAYLAVNVSSVSCSVHPQNTLLWDGMIFYFHLNLRSFPLEE